MYRIIVVPKNAAANVVLFYRELASAEAAHLNIYTMQKQSDVVVNAKDDFGHTFTANVDGIAYALLVNPEKNKELQSLIDPSPVMPRRPTGASNPDLIV